MSEKFYGEGYEKATEDSPDVEYLFKNSTINIWTKRYGDELYFQDSKFILMKNLNEKGITITKDKYNDFRDNCHYRQPIKSKENIMQKSISDLNNEIEQLKQSVNLKMEDLLAEIKALKKEYSYNAQILRTLITKYYPAYAKVIRNQPEFDVQGVEYNKKRITVKYPTMNTEWSLAIMKATIEFCDKESGSVVIFGSERVMTIQTK